MTIFRLKKEKENICQSLKIRKDLEIQISNLLYIEERINNLHSKNLDETNEAIKEILEKNCSLQEEVRKLRREQEIQSIRLC